MLSWLTLPGGSMQSTTSTPKIIWPWLKFWHCLDARDNSEEVEGWSLFAVARRSCHGFAVLACLVDSWRLVVGVDDRRDRASIVGAEIVRCRWTCVDGWAVVGVSGTDHGDHDAVVGGSELERRGLARDQILVEAIARGASYSDAAGQAHCTARTVGRRMTDPTFRARVDERRGQWVTETSGGLAALGPPAVGVLTELLGADDASLRLRAVREVLQQGFRSGQFRELQDQVRGVLVELAELRRKVGIDAGDADVQPAE
jgi:hypothetical protein